MTPSFDWAYDFHEGLAAVQVGDKVGYIRRDGGYAIPPIHHSASGIDFAEGLVADRVKRKVGFMDRTGRIAIQPKYDDVFPFSDGLAPVELEGKWGYVDKTGIWQFRFSTNSRRCFQRESPRSHLMARRTTLNLTAAQRSQQRSIQRCPSAAAWLPWKPITPPNLLPN